MPIDLNELDQIRTKWIPLTGAMKGIEVLVEYASPRLGERFRQRCLREGILLRGNKNSDPDIAPGRDRDFYARFAETYVKDWRGAKQNGEDAPYQPDKLGAVLHAYAPAFNVIKAAIDEDEGFFENGSGG